MIACLLAVAALITGLAAVPRAACAPHPAATAAAHVRLSSPAVHVRATAEVVRAHEDVRLAVRIYVVQPGDTLFSIAQRLGGPSAGWAWLYQANRSRVSDANVIYPGQALAIPAAALVPRATARHSAGGGHPAATASRDGRTGLSGTLGCADLEALWERAGGSPFEAEIAASVAMAESSGGQYATGPLGERGYWQINPVHGSLSSYDPYENARAAVILSADGTNWSAWTTYTSGAYAGRC